MNYDCAIVGAGPAGSSAAYHLAKRGRSVIILEKAPFPRYKPCGGGVSPQIAQWFDFDLTPAISAQVHTICYTWRMGDAVKVELSECTSPIWMVRREIFDRFLVEQAQRQGAQLQASTEAQGIQFKRDRWEVATSGGTVTGRYLIAADGAKGHVAEWLGFKRVCRRAGAIEAEIPATVSESPVLHFELGALKQGYIWNFPKADGYSIGAGKMAGSGVQNFRTLLSEYTKTFNLDLQAGKQCGHPLYLWDGQQKLHTQNALVAGEAACIVDPLTAEGIRPAIFTGIQAALAVDRALSSDLNSLDRYTQILNEQWGSEMQLAKQLARAFYSFPGLAYQLFVKRPSTTRRMQQIFCGKCRYSEVAQRALDRFTPWRAAEK